MLPVPHLEAVTPKIINLTSIFFLVPISVWLCSGALCDYKKIKVIFHVVNVG